MTQVWYIAGITLAAAGAALAAWSLFIAGRARGRVPKNDDRQPSYQTGHFHYRLGA